MLTDSGPVRIEVPREREGTFEPQAEMYAMDVSPDLISSVTDAVLGEVAAWQARPLEAMYPVVFFDALRVKIRQDGVVRNKAVYPALGMLADGTRDILGIWIENTDGAKFWMKVFNDMKTRGCNDVLIAVTDGLKGMGEALAVVYPATTLQTCIVHLMRNSLGEVRMDIRQTVRWRTSTACPLLLAQRLHMQHRAPHHVAKIFGRRREWQTTAPDQTDRWRR